MGPAGEKRTEGVAAASWEKRESAQSLAPFPAARLRGKRVAGCGSVERSTPRHHARPTASHAARVRRPGEVFSLVPFRSPGEKAITACASATRYIARAASLGVNVNKATKKWMMFRPCCLAV